MTRCAIVHIFKKNGIVLLLSLFLIIFVKCFVFNSLNSNNNIQIQKITDDIIRKSISLSLEQKSTFMSKIEDSILEEYPDVQNITETQTLEILNMRNALNNYQRYLHNSQQVNGYILNAKTGKGLVYLHVPVNYSVNLSAYSRLNSPNVVSEQRFKNFFEMQNINLVFVFILVLIGTINASTYELGMHKQINVLFKGKKYKAVMMCMTLGLTMIVTIANFFSDVYFSGIYHLKYCYGATIQSLEIFMDSPLKMTISQMLVAIFIINLANGLICYFLFNIVAFFSQEVKKYLTVSLSILILLYVIQSMGGKLSTFIFTGFINVSMLIKQATWINNLSITSLPLALFINAVLLSMLLILHFRNETKSI